MATSTAYAAQPDEIVKIKTKAELIEAIEDCDYFKLQVKVGHHLMYVNVSYEEARNLASKLDDMTPEDNGFVYPCFAERFKTSKFLWINS